MALPGLVISTEHAQLNGLGLEGFYRAGRRLLSRCRLRVAGREPLPSSARTAGADRTCFVATLRTSSAPGPDPDVVIERTRHADGTERITLRSCASAPLRLPVEVALGTDLADLGAIAAGGAGPELPATVHDSGLRWSSAAGSVSVTATPPPAEALASAGLLRWEFVLPPGGSAGVELRVRADGARPVRAVGRTAADPLASAYATGDDPVVPALLRTGVQDLRALLLRDPAHPADIHTAAGIPWRCGPVPAEALAAARMALPLGTRLAAGTLRVLARTQRLGPGAGAGMIPGPVRDAGPHLPPGCTGTEATLLFPVLLAEARRWGLGTPETQELLPVAERCLTWLRTTVGNGTYVPDPQPHGPVRCETQAHAHRAALLGAELLDDFDRPGGDWLRQWAQRLRTAFRRDFWIDDPAGGRPAAALTSDGGVVPHLGAAAAHLLDTGLLGGGTVAPGLLDPVRTGRLARLLGSPAMDSGWGLRSLAVTEAGYTPSATVPERCTSGTRRSRWRAWPPPVTTRKRVPCCAACWTRPARSPTVCRTCTRGAARGCRRSAAASGGLPSRRHRGRRRSAAADHAGGHPPRHPGGDRHAAPRTQRAVGAARPDRTEGRREALLRAGRASRPGDGGGGRRRTSTGSVTWRDASRRPWGNRCATRSGRGGPAVGAAGEGSVYRQADDYDRGMPYDPSAFPPFAVTVDLVVLTVRRHSLCALAVRRGEPPFQGRWALPGGFVRDDEDLAQAAARELAEETGLCVHDPAVPAQDNGAHLEQLATYGDPGRDPACGW